MSVVKVWLLPWLASTTKYLQKCSNNDLNFPVLRIDKSGELLETRVKPAIEKFFSMRGLQLTPEKTLITHISTRRLAHLWLCCCGLQPSLATARHCPSGHSGGFFASVPGCVAPATHNRIVIRYAWAHVDGQGEQLDRQRGCQKAGSWSRCAGCFLNIEYCMADYQVDRSGKG